MERAVSRKAQLRDGAIRRSRIYLRHRRRAGASRRRSGRKDAGLPLFRSHVVCTAGSLVMALPSRSNAGLADRRYSRRCAEPTKSDLG
jgi:hypothetical protein